MLQYTKQEAKEAAREALQGVFTAFCLPESRSGTLDEAGLRHDVRYSIDVLRSGGLYVHGYYGNFWLLTSALRKHILEIVIDEARGEVPVICRCAHDSLDETLDLVAHAESAGANFISLLGPALAGGTPSMVVAYFEAVAASTHLGISVFNTAQRGYLIAPETLARLAEIENVVALKNHVPIDHTIATRALVGDSAVVVDPEEERFLTNLLEYGQRAIFTGSNMMYDSPRATPMADYVDAALSGDRARTIAGYEAMAELREIHHRWVVEPWIRDGLCPIATVKAWSGLMGMTGGTVRVPLPELPDADRASLRKELVEVGAIDE
jgi:4-hydroxy-tetrahydrodipicolinate synthase